MADFLGVMPLAFEVLLALLTFIRLNRLVTETAGGFQAEESSKLHSVRARRVSSNSSNVRGQSFLRSRDSDRSASNFPPVWHVGQ